MGAKTKAVSNPNGANQWVADPRNQLFIAYYFDPKSETFSNAVRSGIKAGFEETYAKNILSLMPSWLSTKLEEFKHSRLLEKAEKNLETIMDLPDTVQAMGAFGPLFQKKESKKKVKLKNGKTVERKVVEKIPVMVPATSLLKIKNDASQFLAERLGKEAYGKENENGGNKTLVIIVSGESAQRYGANPSPTTDSIRPA